MNMTEGLASKLGAFLLAAATFAPASARADTYSWANLQSDIAGVAQHVDLNLVNPWGMAASTNGVIWVSDNGTGVSTLYLQDGTARSLIVEIPTAKQYRGTGNPTGVVFNGTPFFQVTQNGHSAPALFIFVSEDGSISGWNPTVDPTHAIVAVDNGTNRGVNAAVYKGATSGVASTHNFLYVTNFHTGMVETYDENFHQVNAAASAIPAFPQATRRSASAISTAKSSSLSPSKTAKSTTMLPDPGLASSMCSIRVATSSGAWSRTETSTRHGDLPWWTASSGSAISVTASSTTTIR